MASLYLQNLVLLIAALINFIMSILIFSRGIKRNKINLYFGLLTFFCLTWALGLLLSRSFISLDLSLFFGRSTFVSAIGIVVSLLYFCREFPYRNDKSSLLNNFLLWIPTIFLSFIVCSDYFIFKMVHGVTNYEYVGYFNSFFYWLFFAYFISVSIVALYYLWKKYRNAEVIFKDIIKSLLIVIVIGLIMGLIFDFILLYFANFKFNWLGPIFTSLMNIYVFYLIFNKNK